MLNLDLTLAVTQNFCSHSNFDSVWAKTRKSRKKMSAKLLTQLKIHEPILYQRALHPPTLEDDAQQSSSSS